MGDNYGQTKARQGQPNGLRPGDVSGVTRILDMERWAIAEKRTAKLIARIQPDKPSEDRRQAVANYVERLITQTFPCQVSTFGSVPLKTYLPDGDIDLSAFSDNLHLKDTWANKLHQVLENEEKNENAEFHVKDVQYIPAEVKIIKCLVENIVVDVSFNQLGGLCTLYFLEAIDRLIDQDHLFKRSIILIKAWCYYESRILGAHHGLISTYALETLVLYIFHVFNNSFSGPLEVLYRFLEFFSNFDWENFCVSLWGPVPISSLPNTTAEPPLKNSGELLLSKLFFSICNTISVTFSNGQENQSPPFVSRHFNRHFNVIDPLRANNNLGRSVSKGNFYRIRSALSFGAQRLAGLLECSVNIIVDEIDNFFINTWRRHGSGHRPDLPNPLTKQLYTPDTDTTENLENARNHTLRRETRGESVDLHVVHGCPQPVKSTKQTSQNLATNTPSCSVVHDNSDHHITTPGQIKVRTDHYENVPADNFSNDIFLKVHSSPDLIDPSADIFSRGKQKLEVEEKKQFIFDKPTRSNDSQNLGSEHPGGHSAVFADLSLQQNLSGRGLVYCAPDSNNVQDGYHHHDAHFASSRNELASPSDEMKTQHEMQQDEQDLLNMMTSSGFHSLNGWIHQSTNNSSHLPVLYPNVLVANGYSQRHVAGMVPSSSLIRHPAANSQFPQALALSHYFPNAGLDLNNEARSESVIDSSSMAEMEQENSDHGSWHEPNTSEGFPEIRNTHFQKTISDDRQVSSPGGIKLTANSCDSSDSSVGRQNKFVRGDRSRMVDNYSDASVFPSNKETNLQNTDNSISDFSDFSSKKASKSGTDRRQRKHASSAAPSSFSYNKGKSGRQYEDSSSDHVSVLTDEENRDCVTQVSRNSESSEKSMFSSQSTVNVQGCKLSGSNPTLLNVSDSVIPVSPMLFCSTSPQRDGDSSGGGLTFFPAGPPVPFVMVPFPYYKPPSESHYPGESGENLESLNASHQPTSNVCYDMRQEDPDDFSTDSVEVSSSKQGERHNPDILNSDLVGHWRNLQIGRLCHIPSQGPIVGSSPVMVPQTHLQGHFPMDGSRRPPVLNFNAFSQMMGPGHQFIPFLPHQHGSSRPSSLNKQYREEVPRFRGGTGTYLPDPKVSFLDRQTSSTRHRRGNYHHDWNEHDDRSNWSSSKSRYGGRNHIRSQVDRPYQRINQSSTFDNLADRRSNSHRHGRLSSYETDNNSLGSQRSKHVSASVTHGMHPLPGTEANYFHRPEPIVPAAVPYSYGPVAGDASAEQVGKNVCSSDGRKIVGMFKHGNGR